MKIIFSNYDSPKNPYYSGGGACAVHQIAKRFVDKNRVLVLTGNYPNAKDEVIDGVFYKKVGPSFLGPKLSQIFFNLSLPIFSLRENFDIWMESFTPPVSFSFLPLFTKKPVVGLAHMLSGQDMKRKYKLPFDLIEKIGLKLYSNFIVLTNQDKRKILLINKSARVKVIPNGIEIKKIKARKKSHILFLGRIEIDQKGLDLLLTAYQRVRKKKKIKLVVAGSGNKSQTFILNTLIKKLNLEKNVELTGRVEDRKKQLLFEKALITVIPSRYETFSIVALESMSCGVPIVCFDLPQLRWIPKECSLKAKPFDVGDFEQSILKILESSRLSKKMARKCKDLAKTYSWENVYKMYVLFINQLLDTSQGSIRVYDKSKAYTSG